MVETDDSIVQLSISDNWYQCVVNIRITLHILIWCYIITVIHLKEKWIGYNHIIQE